MAKVITAAVPGPDWVALNPDAPIMGSKVFDLNGFTAEAMGWQRVRLHHPSRANPREVFWDDGVHIREYPDFTRVTDGDEELKSFLRRRGIPFSLSFAGNGVAAQADGVPYTQGESEGEALCRLILHLKKAGKIEKHALDEEHVCQRCGAQIRQEPQFEKACPKPDLQGLC